MSVCKIKLPKRSADNFGAPLSFTINSMGLLNKGEYDSLILDFSEVSFINPHLLIGAMAIMNHAKSLGKKVDLIEPDSFDVSEYLKTIKAPGGLQFSKVLEKTLNVYEDKSYIPLVYFPTDKLAESNNVREELLTAINTLLKNQLNLTGDLLNAVRYIIDEMTQNIVDHSESPRGMLFAQYFPSKNYLDVGIADYGKGLMQSYLDSGKYEPKTHSEAINFAVFGKSTKDIPESRGFGLSTSRRMLVKGLKGKFFLYSGEAFFIHTVEREDIVGVGPELNFPGCYIAMRIPILKDEQFSFYNYLE